MSAYDYDLFVIGAGSGGVRTARMAAAKGVKVAITEDRYLGGTCVNVGCVPKKLFVYASKYAEDFHDAAGYGWSVGTPNFDWATLRDRKNSEIERLNGIYRNMLVNSGCDLIDGRGRLVDEHTVEVGGKQYTAERILLATGGWPFIPEFPGKEHVISSNEVFYLETFPKRAVVVGGGYIAVEFAGIFQGLGASTTVVNRGDMILRGFDDDIRRFAAEEMAKKGIEFRYGITVKEITKLDSGELKLNYSDGSEQVADCVLYATGRVPHVVDLGLENVEVKQQNNGAIIVNDSFQTSVPSIYALGDVTDKVQLTPVALAEGMALVRHLYEAGNPAVDYDLIPTAVFCQPNIGTVGITEEQARERGFDVDIYRSDFRAMKNTLADNPERTLMKMIVDKKTDKVLGIHMAGADAGEIIQGMAVALKAGATKAVFDSTIGIHPTSAEEFVTMREPVKS
ncbi:glutathione-disulfide reductase [Neptunomonas phycophila]|uniref:Glutathione reductase n=1 Tax=Neptunomonas phycophila TaxID=1572645 RepID=A0ABT9EZ57_9GAMM|nr:glutathione-disulfide reductase [Neptunomonas phycophila]MDO6469913.1 glutathione-disulfide reductase [Neptunomonas phycophila]MDP2524331.1 glutathione-disulfide reductase [Neptunomonas phycophila]